MKHIKAFESVTKNKFYSLLFDFLKQINPDLYEVKPYTDRNMKSDIIALSFNIIKQGRNLKMYDSKSDVAFVIKFIPVSDKKERELLSKSKTRIMLDESYGVEDNTTKDLFNFINDTLIEYSYFYKRTPFWNNKSIADFFIKNSDIEKIMNYLSNNFEQYINMKKYNL